jgi:triacylglycerol lipase
LKKKKKKTNTNTCLQTFALIFSFRFCINHAIWLISAAALSYGTPDEIEHVVKNLWAWPDFEFFDVESTDTQAFGMANDELIVVTFRGTESIEDWKTNKDFGKTPLNGVAELKDVKVHAGFQRAYLSVANKVEAFILRHHMANPKRLLYLSGHSLGGALCALCLAHLTLRVNPLPVHGAYTIGSPRVGNKAFKLTMMERCPCVLQRIQNNNDMVPTVPPRVNGFRHLGNFVYLSSSGKLMARPASAFTTSDKAKASGAVANHGTDRYLRHLYAHLHASRASRAVPDRRVELLLAGARGLHAKSGGTDPYVLARFGETRWKSQPIRDTTDPQWNFAVQLPEVYLSDALEIEVYSGSEDCLGATVLAFDTFADVAEKRLKLEPRANKKDKHAKGRLIVADIRHYQYSEALDALGRWSSSSSDAIAAMSRMATRFGSKATVDRRSSATANAAAATAASSPSPSSSSSMLVGSRSPGSSRLRGSTTMSNEGSNDSRSATISVHNAINLKAVSSSSKSDPYCVVRVGGYERRSEPNSHTVAPTWRLEFDVGSVRSGDDVEIEVWHKARTPVFLGRAVVPARAPFDDIVRGGFELGARPLKKDKGICGRVYVSIAYGDADELSSSSSSGLSSSPSPSALGGSGLDELRVATAFLTVHGARDIKAADRSGTSDAYCVVQCEEAAIKFKTAVVKKTLKPHWKETFTLPKVVVGQELSFELYDWDRIGTHTFLGHASLHLDRLAEVRERSLPLNPRAGKHDKHISGEISVSITFTRCKEVVRRQASLTTGKARALRVFVAADDDLRALNVQSALVFPINKDTTVEELRARIIARLGKGQTDESRARIAELTEPYRLVALTRRGVEVLPQSATPWALLEEDQVVFRVVEGTGFAERTRQIRSNSDVASVATRIFLSDSSVFRGAGIARRFLTLGLTSSMTAGELCIHMIEKLIKSLGDEPKRRSLVTACRDFKLFTFLDDGTEERVGDGTAVRSLIGAVDDLASTRAAEVSFVWGQQRVPPNHLPRDLFVALPRQDARLSAAGVALGSLTLRLPPDDTMAAMRAKIIQKIGQRVPPEHRDAVDSHLTTFNLFAQLPDERELLLSPDILASEVHPHHRLSFHAPVANCQLMTRTLCKRALSALAAPLRPSDAEVNRALGGRSRAGTSSSTDGGGLTLARVTTMHATDGARLQPRRLSFHARGARREAFASAGGADAEGPGATCDGHRTKLQLVGMPLAAITRGTNMTAVDASLEQAIVLFDYEPLDSSEVKLVKSTTVGILSTCGQNDEFRKVRVFRAPDGSGIRATCKVLRVYLFIEAEDASDDIGVAHVVVDEALENAALRVGANPLAMSTTQPPSTGFGNVSPRRGRGLRALRDATTSASPAGRESQSARRSRSRSPGALRNLVSMGALARPPPVPQLPEAQVEQEKQEEKKKDDASTEKKDDAAAIVNYEQWSMDDVCAWLDRIGCSIAVDAFRENDIDVETLLELGNEDLTEIGISQFGVRRRILRGISSLKEGTE